MTAFLFIGVGGVGSKAVCAAMESLKSVMPKNVQGLITDTDQQILSTKSDSNLTVLHLDAKDSSRAVQSRSMSPVLNSWLPNYPITTEAEHGLFGNKPLGRLALVINMDAAIDTIDKVLRKASHKTENAEAGIGLDKDDDKSLEVIMCATLGGGTSSISPELAYLVRFRMQELGIKGQIRIIYPFSNTPPESETTSANIYAALIELNHWMDPESKHTFNIGFSERAAWKKASESLNSEDADTAEILSHLDIHLANNISNVNPGFKKSSSKSREQKEDDDGVRELGDDFVMPESSDCPFDSIIFSSISKFDDNEENKAAGKLLIRIGSWSLRSPEILTQIASDLAEFSCNGDFPEPRRFCELHAFQVTRPTKEILATAHGLASQSVMAEIRRILFFKDVPEENIRGSEAAKEFIKTRTLDSLSIHGAYEKRCNSMLDGRYNVERIISRTTEKLQNSPLYGRDLELCFRTLDAELKDLVGQCETKHEFFDSLAACSREYTENCITGLENAVKDFVNGQHTAVAMKAMAEEISRQLSFSLSALHERSNNAIAQASRLEQEKNAAIAALTEFKPTFFQRTFKKVDNAPIERAVKAVTECYKTIFTGYIGREETNAFLNMLNVCEDIIKKLRNLELFLEKAAGELQNISHTAYSQIISGSDESLVSVKEAAEYIDANSCPPDLPLILKEVDSRTNYSIIDIPQNFTMDTWLKMLRDVVGELHPLRDPHVITTLMERNPGERLKKYIENVIAKTSPGLASRLNEDQNAGAHRKILYAAFDQSPQYSKFDDAENMRAQKAGELRSILESEASSLPIFVKNISGSESVDFVQLYCDFSLSDFDMAQHRIDYIRSLVRASRALQSRQDVKFKTIRHTSRQERTNIMILLASAFKLGVLYERPSLMHPVNEQSVQLGSSKWTDLTGIKACLNIFEDPVDAIYLEQTLYQNLIAWRRDSIAENGIEKWLEALEPSPRDLDICADSPIFGSLKLGALASSLKTTMQKELESQWSVWKKLIEKHQASDPAFTEDKITSIAPKGFENWLRKRWEQEKNAGASF